MQFTSLWDDASHDAEKDASLRLLVVAKQAALPAWSFLANARSTQDFEDRLEYAEERLLQAVRVATRDNPQALGATYAALLESLREDFQVMAKEWAKPWEKDENDDDDAEGDKEDSTDEDENNSKDENTDNDADDDDNADDDDKGKKSNKDNEDGDDDKKPPFGKKATYPGQRHDNRYDDQGNFNWDNYHHEVNQYGSGVGPTKWKDPEDSRDYAGGTGMTTGPGVGGMHPVADQEAIDSHNKSCPTCGHMASRLPLVQAAWIIKNEKSKRRAAGPFASKVQALEVLKTRFGGKEGFAVEMESEGKEASAQSDMYARFGPDATPADTKVNWALYHRQQDNHDAQHRSLSGSAEPQTCPTCGRQV